MIQDIAPHKLYNEFRTGVFPKSTDPVFVFRGRELGVYRGEAEMILPQAGDFKGEDLRFLFTLDDQACWLYLGDGPEELRSRASIRHLAYFSAQNLRRNSGVEKHLVFAAYTAMQLSSWYRDNRFCGTCGSKTVPGMTERSIVCPSCGRAIYPRVIPAVIVGVINGDYLLHTKYVRNRNIPFYALIAGFTEIGETFEECVAREVMEESGLKVKNIRYFKSQPWGMVDDLLAGFYCDVDGDPTIHIDTEELAEGVWIHRKDIVGQPDDASLTNHMMITFREGKEPPAKE